MYLNIYNVKFKKNPTHKCLCIFVALKFNKYFDKRIYFKNNIQVFNTHGNETNQTNTKIKEMSIFEHSGLRDMLVLLLDARVGRRDLMAQLHQRNLVSR